MVFDDEISFGGAIATNLLIGRGEEQEKIRRAVGGEAGRDFRCVMIEAEGGLGKTRLLREIARLLGRAAPADGSSAQASWAFPNVIVLPLIDVADPYLHTIVPFLRAVREGLERVPNPDVSESFQSFDEVVEVYERARDGEKSFSEVAELRQQVSDVFMAAYASLTRSWRVVWLIDTFEQLFRSREEIESLFTEGTVIERPTEQLTANWLRDFIWGLPEQTTMILAGRPRPHVWTSEIATLINTSLIKDDAPPADAPWREDNPAGALQARLKPVDRSPAGTTILTTFTLKNFTPAQIREYLEALSGQLAGQPDFVTLAAYLDDNLLADAEQPEIIHLLTDGNPIRLAIYIDLLLNSDADVQAFHKNLDAMQAMSRAERAQLRGELDRALLGYLTDNLGKPEHQVIELLALMRRGLDLERLCAIWRDDEEIARQTIRNLLRLSFVKFRWKTPSHISHVAEPDPAEIKLFLHDEFYAIYQRSFLNEDVERLELRRIAQRELYRKLILFCEQRLQEVLDIIPEKLAALNALTPRIDDKSALPAEREQYRALKEELRILRHERRLLGTEALHYELYQNAEWAFYERYFRRSERAFSANAVEHDTQLQSEIDLFFFGNTAEENSRQVGLAGERWEQLRFAVVLQQVSSWIKRLTSYYRFADAASFATKALNSFFDSAEQWYETWLPAARETQAGKQIEHLYRLEWEAGRYFAAIFEGRRINEAIAGLERVREHLEWAIRTLEEAHTEPVIPGLEDLEPLTRVQSARFNNVVAQCLLMTGYAYASLTQFGTARRYYVEGIEVVERTGFQTLRAELKNDLARVLGELGDLGQAQLFCQEGLVIRRARGFDSLSALSYNTMALIYARNWLPVKARIWAESALLLFRQLDQTRGIGLALLQVAEARRRLVSLTLTEAQMLQADLKARVALPPSLLVRVRADLAKAAEHLQEAEQIFSRRVPEHVRLIEVYNEKSALFREWSDLLGEDAHGEKFTQAMEAHEQVVALTSATDASGDDFAKLRLAALVNRARLYQRIKDKDRVRQALAEAENLVEPGYVLHTTGPLELKPAGVKEVFFRELGRMETIRASLALDEHDDELAIRHYVLAVTYHQLYSPYDVPYLGLTLRRLATLLDRRRERSGDNSAALKGIIRKTMTDYHLYALKEYFEEREQNFKLGPRTDLAVEQFSS